MKILLICPTTGQIINFRKTLIEKLQSEGHEIYTIAFDEVNRAIIESRNVKHFCVGGSNRNLNPLKILRLKSQYVRIINQIQPDIVFTFMLKPNIFGVLAARKAKVKNIFSMVEGAGDVFTNRGFKWKIIRYVVCKLYAKSLKYSKKVFFLNQDDKNEFISRKLVKEAQCIVIPGIGVDIDHFAFKPVKNYKTFLMVARMVKAKGVIEYCKAARIVKQQYPDAVFNYLGEEWTMKISDIQEYIDDGSINYLGTTRDVRPFLEDVLLLLLLSSYREGMPMAIMEAEAVGRGIITSNSVGCKDTVIDGYNGFLVECGDYEAMAEKIIWCIEHPIEAEQFGINSRKLAEKKFDSRLINNTIYSNIFIEQ